MLEIDCEIRRVRVAYNKLFCERLAFKEFVKLYLIMLREEIVTYVLSCLIKITNSILKNVRETMAIQESDLSKIK